jgi:hypothetical protein
MPPRRVRYSSTSYSTSPVAVRTMFSAVLSRERISVRVNSAGLATSKP